MLKVLNDPSFIHEVVQLKQEIQRFNAMDYNIIEIVDDDMGGIMIEQNGKLEKIQAIDSDELKTEPAGESGTQQVQTTTAVVNSEDKPTESEVVDAGHPLTSA